MALSPSPLGMFRDATIVTPFDPADPRLSGDVTLSLGASSKSMRWRRETMPMHTALELFARHNEAADKDGPSAVLGALSDKQRTTKNVQWLEFVGLDVDCGVDGDELRDRIVASRLMAVLVSTHSHMKTESSEPLDAFVIWARKNGLGDEITDETAQARLRAKGLLPSIADHATASLELRGGRRFVRYEHPPIPKWRVITPLKEAFVIADHGATDGEGLAAWRGVPKALAEVLGGLPIDKSGCDPNRLFYLPTHAPGRPWEAYVFGGAFFDADTALAHAPTSSVIASGAPRSAADGPISKRWAARRADGFQIADLIRDTAEDRIRADHGEKLTVECPNDGAHTNAGDTADAGCYVENAGASAGGGFRWSCRHNACTDLDRLDMLNLAITEGWFTADDVTSDDYDALDRSDETLSPTRATGEIAVNGVLDGLEEFDPERRVFEGPTACDDAVEELSKVAAVLTQGNRTRIAIKTRNGLVFNSKSDAATRFESYRAVYESTDAKGKPKLKEAPALALLLKSDRVAIFDGIDCDPTDTLPTHILNTWQGIAVAPAPGDCSLLLAHLRNSVCAGDDSHYNTLLGFFAHMLQRPAEKPGFAPVVIGPKGCGKSTIGDFLCRAIGRHHAIKIAQAKHLTGAFNAHLAGKLFVQAEEVTFGGDRKNEGVLKDAITARTMLTEPKGLDAYQESNFSRFFLVTNPGHAVPASDGERRWFVLQARDLFAGTDHDDPARVAYFDALHEEADNGGIAAFVDFLLRFDISEFRPYAPPRTEALADQVRRSLGDDDLWVMGALQTGTFDMRDGDPISEEWRMDAPLEIDVADLQRSFDSHVSRYSGSSGGSGLGREVLARYGAVEKRRRGTGDRRHFYVLPPREDMRQAFTARYGIAFDADPSDLLSGASGRHITSPQRHTPHDAEIVAFPRR